MPLYEYECDACGHRFEHIHQKYSDPPIEKCPKCGGHVHKLMSSPAIQFKGSGFYITDYAKKEHVAASKADSQGEHGAESKGESKGEAKGESKGEAKGDAKGETKSDAKTEPKAAASSSGDASSPAVSTPSTKT